jgi:hypothetical protein
VKIAYALDFANLADFVSAWRFGQRGLHKGDPPLLDRPAHTGSTARVFVDANSFRNLYDDPIT